MIVEARFYINPYSLLYIDIHGKLRRAYCPFKAKALYETPFTKGQVVLVSQVKMHGLYRLHYIIEGKEYESMLFNIIS